MILVTVAAVVAIAAIVAVGMARPRRSHRAQVDIVFRTRLEAASVELDAGDRTIAGALIGSR